MVLGEKIKKYRLGRDLSQEKLAEKVGVSRQAVTKWESNQSAPSTENLLAIAEVLDISIDELIIKPSGKKRKKGTINIDKYNNYNILAYILGCTSFIGLIQYQNIPATMWLIFALMGGLALLYSNIKYRNIKYLKIDVVNIIILFTVIQILPRNIGIFLNVLILILVLILLFIKTKIVEK